MARPQTKAYESAIQELAKWIIHKKNTNQYITHRQYLDFALYLEKKHGVKSLNCNIKNAYTKWFKIDPLSNFYIDYIKE